MWTQETYHILNLAWFIFSVCISSFIVQFALKSTSCQFFSRRMKSTFLPDRSDDIQSRSRVRLHWDGWLLQSHSQIHRPIIHVPLPIALARCDIVGVTRPNVIWGRNIGCESGTGTGTGKHHRLRVAETVDPLISKGEAGRGGQQAARTSSAEITRRHCLPLASIFVWAKSASNKAPLMQRNAHIFCQKST